MKLKLAPSYNISFLDYPNLNEWCTTLYTIGCPHQCQDCHNVMLKDSNYNVFDELTVEECVILIKALVAKNNSNNVVIMGGEPLAPWNIDAIKSILTELSNEDINICIYTGYSIDYVKSNDVKGFKYIKTGFYDKTRKTEPKLDGCTDFILASTNQQVWDSNYALLSKDGKFKI